MAPPGVQWGAVPDRQIVSPLRDRPLPIEHPGTNAIDEEEVEAVTRVLRSRRLFRYAIEPELSEVSAFESELASFIGIRHALAVTSGTAALQVALDALGVGPGMEVIVPAYLWISVVSAVTRGRRHRGRFSNCSRFGVESINLMVGDSIPSSLFQKCVDTCSFRAIELTLFIFEIICDVDNPASVSPLCVFLFCRRWSAARRMGSAWTRLWR